MKVFLAGAGGAIGRRLVPLLIEAGHSVTGTTRSGESASELRARGVTAVVVDAFNAVALRDAMARAQPEGVMHQLTDLPKVLDKAPPARGRARPAASPATRACASRAPRTWWRRRRPPARGG